jgi:hypothetical protein
MAATIMINSQVLREATLSFRPRCPFLLALPRLQRSLWMPIRWLKAGVLRMIELARPAAVLPTSTGG